MDLVTTLSPLAIKLAASYLTDRTTGPAEQLAIEAASNSTHRLEDLLEKDPSIDRGPAFVAAAAAGRIEALDILLNTATSSRKHLHHHRHSSVAEDTQKLWLNTICSGTTPLLEAVKGKHGKTADFLLESGADPNLCGKHGPVALLIAAKEGDLEAVKSLLSFGADVDWKDSAGDTALIVASRWRHAHVAHYLLKHGAEVNARNDKGGTALLVAARHDCVEVVEVLLQKGADITARDRKGLGVLHRAVEGKWLVEQVPASVKARMLKVLLEAGADPAVKDGKGKTAAQKVGWMEGGDNLRRLLDGKEREIRFKDRVHTKDLVRRCFDIQAILDSYDPPETEFNNPESVDESTYKSGSVTYLKLESSTTSNRTIKTTHLDIAPLISKAGVRGVVSTVAHGSFHSQPASLLVFSFALRSGDHGFRFENAHVKITFSKHPSAPASQLSPVVLKFAPRKIFGLPTVEGRKNRIGGEISLQIPAGAVTVGPTVSGERESEYEKEHRYGCIGNYWSSKHAADWDVVYWDVKENKRTKHGIPDRLNVAVVVEREGVFTASVEVSVDTPIANGIFAFPWSKTSPVTFSPEVVTGKQPRTAKFDELTNSDWRSMIPYEDEWENKFSEETMRSAAPASIPGSAGRVADAALSKTESQVAGEGIAMTRYEIGVEPLEVGEESDDR
ncbi:Ankyrin repeat-rich membrane-spanning [Hyphodiscus hymeniophilus]|uniref:Ankyrin repeat-rich membrane-spanning n=1 Tax=Hyphodiscus hymeniophilus TaxID=353542 RepID=A0A9P7AVU6_9HELO|nr:Ankyrin repeat-rich membrane-spanning [Hyphodiscus hymeniophilus]